MRHEGKGPSVRMKGKHWLGSVSQIRMRPEACKSREKRSKVGTSGGSLATKVAITDVINARGDEACTRREEEGVVGQRRGGAGGR